MKKSDIKNGMHVITNNGEEYIIISGIKACGQIKDNNTASIVMVNMDAYGGWMSFDDYDDDLRFHDPEGDEYGEDRCYDIKEVYSPLYYAWTLLSVNNKNFIDKFTKVWERPRKKMTKAEIEKELGYEIEIVESED
jgi:hypothetical protein